MKSTLLSRSEHEGEDMNAIEVLEQEISHAQKNARTACWQGNLREAIRMDGFANACQTAIYALEAEGYPGHTEKDAISVLRAHISHAMQVQDQSFAEGWMNESRSLGDLIRDYWFAINALEANAYLEEEGKGT